MKKQVLSLRTCLIQAAFVAAGMAGVVLSALPAGVTISNEPLAQPATAVKPNIMFILDDSGSMDQDYTPDYINDSQSGSATASCFSPGDGNGGLITGTPAACQFGDVPYMTPDFNTQYYNPDIYYRPAVDYTTPNFDGRDMTPQTSANTKTWTAVRSNPYQTTSTVNLATGYSDRVWCTSQSDSATDTALCKTNTSYSYPDRSFPYGLDTSNAIKYKTGAPYYYRLQPSEYCNDPDLRTCTASSTKVGICPDNDPNYTTNSTCFTYPAYARHCTSTAYTSCQKVKISPYLYPKFLGTVTGVVAGPGRGTLTIGNSGNDSTVNISGVTINGQALISASYSAAGSNGVSVTSGVITASTGTNASNERNSVASALRDAINNYSATSGYSATVSSAVVTISTTTNTSAANGYSPVVTSNSVGVTAATGSITINNSSSAVGTHQVQVYVNSGATALYPTAGSATCAKPTNSTTRQTCASNIATAINNNKTAGLNHGYGASASSGLVTITAPLSQGSGANGQTITLSGQSPNTSAWVTVTTTPFAGGVTGGSTPTTAVAIANGAAATTIARTGVGSFTRTDIIPSVTTYPRAATRSDCTASSSSCSYDEEMTNFANWYAYYRTRLQMMKAAAGRAFHSIDDTFRVGFITINPGSPVGSSKYLKINDFTSGSTGQKVAWYSKFYGTSTSGGTPLREALSRVGRLYAGKFDGINNGIPAADDPVQVSCQPNFAILTTDGYWTNVNGYGGTENVGRKLDNSTMTDIDGLADSLYSKRSDGVYDGRTAANTLADVALYYYQTDLRPAGSTNAAGTYVYTDNVPQTQSDTNAQQHMVTFTLGLGLDGALTYQSNYNDTSVTTGDFYRIKIGASTCAAGGGGTGASVCNWPTPVQNSPTALDDLWHAAVNGRGLFFSAKNPSILSQALDDTLAAMRTRVGAGAAAATSNLQPVAGDNFAFTAQYTTVSWVGDLKSRTIDLSTGIVSKVQLWSAQSTLDTTDFMDRRIYTLDASDTAGNLLRHFCWPGETGTNCSDGSGLTSAEMTSYFDPATKLGNYTSLTSCTGCQQSAVSKEKLLDFVRGDTSNEDNGNTSNTDLFRQRVSVLGDIVNGQPAYVRNSPFSYNDTGYSDFRKCTDGTGTGCPAAQFPAPTIRRKPTVYVGANDGMVHAFEVDVNNSPYYQTAGISTDVTTDDTFSAGNNTGNGQERWAYIPSLLLPNVAQLADTNYQHRYYVDGSPQIGDICLTTPCAGLNDWRTILVGGLNSGGKGFYALDITNPDAPKALWEFGYGATCRTAAQIDAAPGTYKTDCNVGLSYGNPIITKRKSDGKWIVIVTSGYNNCSPGDGKGYLYLLDAATGGILKRISTATGTGGTDAACTGGTPSNLARINNWVENGLLDNTTLAVYGGDMLGNVWRFDLDSANATTVYTAFKLTTVKDASSNVQPITVRPELGEAYGYRVVLLGTGAFLGAPDKSSTATQSIYAIRDDLSTTAVVIRTDQVQQTLGAGSITDTRTVTTTTGVDWDAKKGWYIDLPDSGERVNVDPQLQLGTLVIASNVPNNDTCSAGGYAWQNYIDFKTGRYIATSTGAVASTKIASSLIVGLNVVQLPGGKVVTIVTTADNQQLTRDTPVPSTAFTGNRISWRELTGGQ